VLRNPWRSAPVLVLIHTFSVPWTRTTNALTVDTVSVPHYTSIPCTYTQLLLILGILLQASHKGYVVCRCISMSFMELVLVPQGLLVSGLQCINTRDIRCTGLEPLMQHTLIHQYTSIPCTYTQLLLLHVYILRTSHRGYVVSWSISMSTRAHMSYGG